MSAVQQQRLYTYQYPGIPDKDISIRRFADMICAGLVERERRILPKGLHLPATKANMKRVVDRAGNNTKNPTKKQKTKGMEKGSQKQLTCFVCRRYKKQYSYTTATCAHCRTPVCMDIDRSKDHPDRVGSCLHEHLNTPIPELRFNGSARAIFPKKHKLWSS
jgi:hypothetical protein